MGPSSLLRDKGFDPEGDLCEAVKSKVHGWGMRTSTAIGHEQLARPPGRASWGRFLWEHGAASTIRTKNTWGWTPMWVACARG